MNTLVGHRVIAMLALFSMALMVCLISSVQRQETGAVAGDLPPQADGSVDVYSGFSQFWSRPTTNTRSVRLSSNEILETQENNLTVEALPDDDFANLIDLTDFRFLINSHRCHHRPNHSNILHTTGTEAEEPDVVFLVVFVHSRPSNFERRELIRRTWGNQSLFDGFASTTMRVVFMLGDIEDQAIQKDIDKESQRYGDIVQGNFMDTYRNLTYKHIMGLKWIAYHCRQARFVLKTDDDIFVDIFQLMFYLKRQERWPTGRPLMACYVITNPYPKRSQRSKWRVSWTEYPYKYYPHYCSGWGILMSPDVAFKLYAQSRSLPYFWVDDVHVSGLLARRIGVEHTDFNLQLAIGPEEIEDFLKSKQAILPPLFGLPDSSLEDIERLWRRALIYYRTKYPPNSIANI